MAYFDNAATTFPKPQCVYDFMDSFYRSSGGNAGRGNYSLSVSTSKIIKETRELLKLTLHCPQKEVIFEPSATISLNVIIQSLIKTGAKTVYISPFEHNAVTRTLHFFESQNKISVHVLSVSSELQYDLKKIQYQFEETAPDLLIISHVSNVIGLVAPIIDICTCAKKYGAKTVVDMAQSAGLVDCNIGLEVFDFAVFAGHKTLLGPTGIGGFVMNPSIDLPPIIFGGTGTESANQDMPLSLPERFECGTLNSIGIAGLNAALKWIRSQGPNTLLEKELQYRHRLIELLSEYSFINIVGNNNTCSFTGIVSCTIKGLSSDSAGDVFSSQDISVRTGLQCAPLAHKTLNTFPEGTIRFSVNSFNTETDFEKLEKALEYIKRNL